MKLSCQYYYKKFKPVSCPVWRKPGPMHNNFRQDLTFFGVESKQAHGAPVIGRSIRNQEEVALPGCNCTVGPDARGGANAERAPRREKRGEGLSDGRQV